METSKIKSLERSNKILISLIYFSSFVFVISLATHTTPLRFISDLLNFASHHYFISSFIAASTAAIGLKYYFSNKEKIKEIKSQKKPYSRLLLRPRNRRNLKSSIYSNPLAKDYPEAKVDTKEDNEMMFLGSEYHTEALERIQINLQLAMKMGNSFKHKVRISYRDEGVNKIIETTVWYADERHVILKGGLIIPVKFIYSVEL